MWGRSHVHCWFVPWRVVDGGLELVGGDVTEHLLKNSGVSHPGAVMKRRLSALKKQHIHNTSVLVSLCKDVCQTAQSTPVGWRRWCQRDAPSGSWWCRCPHPADAPQLPGAAVSRPSAGGAKHKQIMLGFVWCFCSLSCRSHWSVSLTWFPSRTQSSASWRLLSLVREFKTSSTTRAWQWRTATWRGFSPTSTQNNTDLDNIDIEFSEARTRSDYRNSDSPTREDKKGENANKSIKLNMA